MQESNTIFTVDNGNSHPHVGVFESGHLRSILNFKKFENSFVHRLSNMNCSAVISHVGQHSPLIDHVRPYAIDLHQYIQDQTFFDMKFEYTDTIGHDRLFQAYYIYKTLIQTQKANRICHIDAGTFTTLDIISSSGLKGGFIAPGMQTILNSYDQGAKLPLLDELNINTDKEIKIPHSTEDAILNTCLFFQRSFYKSFFEIYNDFDMILISGGRYQKHFEILSSILDENISIQVNPNHIHYSLIYIHQRHQEYSKQ